MKKAIFIFVVILSHHMLHGQSIELDHTKPSIKVFDSSSDLGAELGYYNSGSELLGYHLSIHDQTGDEERIHFFGGNQGNAPFMEFVDNNGDPVIRIKGYGSQQGDDKGRVTTDQLEITAGADLAEYFDIEEVTAVVPGMITAIDSDNAGVLTLSNGKYDKKVVGVVSGANGLSSGMFMGQRKSIAHGSHPIALTGRAYVYASDENGEIEPGDFLTTSSIPGYAMKARKMKKARGAIIGKAMSSIDENGFVLILINLQ